MKISKVINNNIVSAFNEDGQEIILMGKGLGYRAKDSGEIADPMIEKIFRMDSQNATDKLKELFSSLPLEHIQVSDKIIAYADKLLGKRLSKTIYITLTDHINFAISRFKEGMLFQNALLIEVRMFYHQEYLIGEYALDLIEQELGIRLPIDEAASIALHIVNAEYDTSISESVNIAKLINNVLQIVRDTLGIELDQQSLYYDRFVTHLKFLAQRIFKGDLLDTPDHEFNRTIARMYPSEYKCSKRIAAFIRQEYERRVTDEEIAYLTVHIKRISTPG